MIVVATQQIKKAYGANPVLDNVTMEIHAGERIGIVGPNGAGKTTLFKQLAGIETPDGGEIYRAKGSRWVYLPQSPNYPQLTGREVVLSAFQEAIEVQKQMRRLEEGMSITAANADQLEPLMKRYQVLLERFEQLDGYQMDTIMAQVVEGLGISQANLDSDFDQLSGGEKTKIGLAKLLCQQSDVLLLDEPTNHLDVESMEWLEGFIREYPGTVLIISHDRYFLDAVVTSIYEVDGGEVELYLGNYSAFVKEKEERLLRQFAEFQEQQRKIKKMQEAIKRLKEWGNRTNPPNAAFHRRAKSMEKALARIERIERPKLEADRMGLVFQKTERSGKEVLVAEQLDKSFVGKELFSNANLLVRYGERKALLGPNGCGKSTLIKMLLGEVSPDRGSVRIGSSVKVGYLSQKALEGDQQRRVIDVFRETVAISEAEARHRLAKFLFYGEHVFKKAGQLSGGERMRLRLAQLMHQEINLLILDEPTNHLDIEARETLEEAIADFRGSLFIVSHDRYFLQKMVDGVFWVDGGQIMRYEGTYEEAREKRKKTIQMNADQKVNAAMDRTEISSTAKRKEMQGITKTAEPSSPVKERVNPYKLAKLEEEISGFEGKREELQQFLLASDAEYQKLVEWQRDLESCDRRLEELYEAWYAMQEKE